MQLGDDDVSALSRPLISTTATASGWPSPCQPCFAFNGLTTRVLYCACSVRCDPGSGSDVVHSRDLSALVDRDQRRRGTDTTGSQRVSRTE